MAVPVLPRYARCDTSKRKMFGVSEKKCWMSRPRRDSIVCHNRRVGKTRTVRWQGIWPALVYFATEFQK